jgi:hypothetical protein
MGRFSTRGALSLATALTLAASIGPAAAGAADGPGQDGHYFLMTASSSGNYKADYGNDRFEPGQNTAFGVDGTETGKWSWHIRAVGRSVGNGPIRSAAAQFRGKATHAANLISWTIQKAGTERGESKLCQGEDAAPRKTLSRSERFGRGDIGPGQWISGAGSSIQYRSGGFAVSYPLSRDLVEHCYHGLPLGLQLYSSIRPSQTPVPRGDFNPRSDRSYSNSWGDSVNEVEGAGGPQEHKDTASVEFTIDIKSVSESKAKRKRAKYSQKRPGDALYGLP